jgi:hypothetical protein
MSQQPWVGEDLFHVKESRIETAQATAPVRRERPVNIPPGGNACFICGEDAPFGKGDLRRPETLRWACRRHRRELG